MKIKDLSEVKTVNCDEKKLILTQLSPGFLGVCSTSLLKTPREEEKLLVTSNFSFSLCVLDPFEELSSIFIKFEIVLCANSFSLEESEFCRLGKG